MPKDNLIEDLYLLLKDEFNIELLNLWRLPKDELKSLQGLLSNLVLYKRVIDNISDSDKLLEKEIKKIEKEEEVEVKRRT